MEPGAIVDDRFEVLKHHAEGGMGVVYRGRDRESGGPVAIKIVSIPTDVELGRFEREVALLATLSHPGVVGYIAHGSTKLGHRYLVQEWIEGKTLHERLVTEGLTRSEALDFVRQVALALAEAHELGIVHRDIKPNNLIVESGSGRVRVLDFGLARLTESNDRVTRTGTAVGTPGYMAPEQIIGTLPLTPQVDVFALGCVLYRALSGHHPFAGRDPAAVRTKVLMCEPPRLDRLCDDIPKPIADLTARMLAKDPGDRPANASDEGEYCSVLLGQKEAAGE